MASRRKAWFWSVLVWLVLSASALYPAVANGLLWLVAGTVSLGLVAVLVREASGGVSLWWTGTRPLRVAKKATDD